MHHLVRRLLIELGPYLVLLPNRIANSWRVSATNRKFDFGRKLTSTKFAPGFQINLTSVGELTAQGYKVLFESEATVTKMVSLS